MEVGAAMASVSSCATSSSSLLALTASAKQVNVQELGSFRALCGGVKLSGSSRVMLARTGRGSAVRVISKQASVSTPTKESAVEKEAYDCVVVGAGISGLCTAQALATRYMLTVCLCPHLLNSQT